jgi:hypothetical protein
MISWAADYGLKSRIYYRIIPQPRQVLFSLLSFVSTVNTEIEAIKLLHCANPIAALARRISSSSSAVSLASVSPMRTRFRLPVNLNGTL